MGQRDLADADRVDAWGAHHLARGPVPHYGDIRSFIRIIRPITQFYHGTRISVRSRADHRADVSALHLLYDHRSEDDGETEMGSMPGGFPGGRDGDGFAIG